MNPEQFPTYNGLLPVQQTKTTCVSMVPFFNLTKQYNVIKSEIDEATARVMKKGCFILGLEVAAFEKNYLYPFSVNQLPNAYLR